MLKIWKIKFILILMGIIAISNSTLAVGLEKANHQTDPLPSWNNDSVKKTLLDFVQATTDETNPHYIPPNE